MESSASKILFQEDEEDNLDDPIRLLDFEQHAVFCASENYLRNITIEDPGCIVNISSEDYELKPQKSSSQLKKLKNPIKSSGYINNNNNDLLSKCCSCSIKLVDCHKFPWYYRKKLGSTNITQYPKTKQEVIEIKKGTDKEEIMVIDLTKKHTEYNHVNKEKISETHWNEFTSIDNSVCRQVRKGTYKTLSKPVLNIQNESYINVPISEAEQDSDLIISEYSRTIDKEIQKFKSNIECTQNNTNRRNNLSIQFLLGSKSLIKNCVNFSQATKEKIGKVPRDVINNDSTTVLVHNYKKKNGKDSKKIKYMYRSEPITKTKLKIIKSSLKTKDIIPHKNYYKEMEQKGCSPHLNTTNNKQCDHIKTIERKPNSLTNKNKQNHCENKLDRVHTGLYTNLLRSSPVLAKIITETKTASHRNIGPERLHECYKQLHSSDRILPNFPRNTCLNRSDIVSKSNTEGPKRTKEIINNYEMKKNKQSLDFTKGFNMIPMVSQIPKPSMQQTIHCIGNNNAIININKTQKKICNTNVDISNNLAFHFVNLPHVTNKLPGNNEMMPKKSHASPDVIIENVNNINFISQSKIEAAQLEEERLRYLLPSNWKLPDPQMQNLFACYSRRNLNTSPYTDKRI